MNYKRAYRPSELLCPRHFRWVPLSAALPRLDAELCPALVRGRRPRLARRRPTHWLAVAALACLAQVDLTEEEAEDEAYVNDMMKGAATQELVMELDGGSRYLLFKVRAAAPAAAAARCTLRVACVHAARCGVSVTLS